MHALRTSLIILGVVMAFHAMSPAVTSLADAQESSSNGKKAPSSSSGGSSSGGGDTLSAKEKLTKLEKAEDALDKEIKEERERRENATSSTSSSSSSSSSSSKNGKDDGSLDELCNNGLQVDFSKPGSVTLCTCGIRQVLVNGTCQEYNKGDLTVLAEKHVVFTVESPVANYRVHVQDLDCPDGTTHRNLTFEKGQFYLRNRGDIVLTDGAGHLAGLRISDYCIEHYLKENNSDTVSTRLKACVPHPNVPRCCPANQVLINNTCVTGPSPEYLSPPILADPRGGDPVNWPVVRNQVNNLTCDADSRMSVDLNIDGSYVLALANGLAYRWYANGPLVRSEFKFCPDFCIDGRQSVDGTFEYHVNFCHKSEKNGEKAGCKTDSCIRKCCKPGEIMSVDHYRCMKYDGEKFEPPVAKNLSEYEIIVERPSCAVHMSKVDFSSLIDEKGIWQVDGFTLDSKRYCMDTFAIQGRKSPMALMCPGTGNIRLWWQVRRVIFPVCHVISLVFLGITVGFYLLAPVLLKQGGWHQLSYVLSLMLAYASTFSLNVFHRGITKTECIGMALLMQLGFLSTFFWLCVMCFDIESKIRSLRKFQAYVPLHSLAYVAFGFGGPLFISMLTLIIHATVPYGTPWVVTPALGISRCWFHGDTELLVYFYGPIAILFLCNIGLIASTAWNYMRIEKGALGLAMKSQNEGVQSSQQPPLEYDRQKQTRKNFAEFKHTFLLLSLMCFCWITELLSWKIPPAEIWAFTDVLNSLQGLFIFVIFLSNRRNRKILKNRHPWLYSVFRPVKNFFRKIRGLFLKRSKNYSNSAEEGAGFSREPSISSEFSELSENYKPTEPPTAS